MARHPHPSTNFHIQKYYEQEPKFNSVYSRNNLSTMKDVEYIINLDSKNLIAFNQKFS